LVAFLNLMASFKIFFSAENIRRFRTEKCPAYDEFIVLMAKQYSQFHPELRIQYVDTEGDRIDVNSQHEWQEMFEELKNESIIKIHVLEGKTGQYFKDGPPPQPLYFYQENPAISESTSDLQSRVPQCLQELFPGKHILPYNIPSFLEGIVTISNLPNNEVDLDVDIPKLRVAIHKKGLSLLQNKEYAKGRYLFHSLCILDPQEPNAHYNFACSEALLGNIPGALSALRKAVNVGFNNVQHMQNDRDLDSIRNTPEFAQILYDIECKLYPPLVISEPVPSSIIPSRDTLTNQPSPAQKWASELSVLHDIGFLDDELSISLLERNQGSVEKTVLELM